MFSPRFGIFKFLLYYYFDGFKNVTGKGKYPAWELTDIDQIWAEAVEYYNRGEELFLKGEIAEQAYAMQREAMETDDREGIVEEYLNTLLPDEWSSMDLYERKSYLNGTEFGEVKRHGTIERDKVCTMEIWCECFGKPRESLKKSDSYEIEGILYKLGVGSVIREMPPARHAFPVMECKRHIFVLPMETKKPIDVVSTIS